MKIILSILLSFSFVNSIFSIEQASPRKVRFAVISSLMREAALRGYKLDESEKIDEDSIEAQDSHNRIVLHYAALSGNCEMIKVLCQRNNIDIDAKDKDGKTPLHYAVSSLAQNQKEIIISLLEEGANINAKDNSGNTPLHCAIFLGKKEIIDLLVEEGADQSIQNNQNKTAEQYIKLALL